MFYAQVTNVSTLIDIQIVHDGLLYLKKVASFMYFKYTHISDQLFQILNMLKLVCVSV